MCVGVSDVGVQNPEAIGGGIHQSKKVCLIGIVFVVFCVVVLVFLLVVASVLASRRE